MAAPGGSLRTLLGAIEQDDGARRLAAEGGRAFVSASLRPYVIAALADRDDAARERPMLVVGSLIALGVLPMAAFMTRKALSRPHTMPAAFEVTLPRNQEWYTGE